MPEELKAAAASRSWSGVTREQIKALPGWDVAEFGGMTADAEGEFVERSAVLALTPEEPAQEAVKRARVQIRVTEKMVEAAIEAVRGAGEGLDDWTRTQFRKALEAAEAARG